MKRESRAPLIVAIVLLLLPLLYVGSYFALVVPGRFLVYSYQGPGREFPLLTDHRYRWGGKLADRCFWPVEQIDRKLRPNAWDDSP